MKHLMVLLAVSIFQSTMPQLTLEGGLQQRIVLPKSGVVVLKNVLRNAPNTNWEYAWALGAAPVQTTGPGPTLIPKGPTAELRRVIVGTYRVKMQARTAVPSSERKEPPMTLEATATIEVVAK